MIYLLGSKVDFGSMFVVQKVEIIRQVLTEGTSWSWLDPLIERELVTASNLTQNIDRTSLEALFQFCIPSSNLTKIMSNRKYCLN